MIGQRITSLFALDHGSVYPVCPGARPFNASGRSQQSDVYPSGPETVPEAVRLGLDLRDWPPLLFEEPRDDALADLLLRCHSKQAVPDRVAAT
jgi:hypothetical protein